MKHTCPVCGFPKLTEAPRSKSGGGSFEICPSCGFQFGVSDDDQGFTYAKWRARWKKSGMKWAGVSAAPKNWNPAAQLKPLEAKKKKPG
jgi:hypothetical protein